MSYKCEGCGIVAQSGVTQVKVVIETREVSYSNGAKGEETVKEMVLCSTCRK